MNFLVNKKILDFWKNKSKNISWYKNPQKIIKYNIKDKTYDWFYDGFINASYNCLEVNIKKGLQNKIAIYAVDNNGILKSLTYKELLDSVNCFADFLKQKFDCNKKIKRIMVQSSASLETTIVILAPFKPDKPSSLDKGIPIESLLHFTALQSPTLIIS